MAEIIKVYKQHLPALRLIGKAYQNCDRGASGGFGEKWQEWFEKGYFTRLEETESLPENEGAYLGYMTCSKEEDSFVYWIGISFPANTPVPEGFQFQDVPESDVGVCWIYGSETNDNLYGMHDDCMRKLEENGMGNFREDFGDGEKRWTFFERYQCPRFTTPDEHGKIILDYAMYLNR